MPTVNGCSPLLYSRVERTAGLGGCHTPAVSVKDVCRQSSNAERQGQHRAYRGLQVDEWRTAVRAVQRADAVMRGVA